MPLYCIGTQDWFLYWHTQVHSVSETSCSKSPTFRVCAVTFRAICLRVRLLIYTPKPLQYLPVCLDSECLNIKCHALVDVPLSFPDESECEPCPVLTAHHIHSGHGEVYSITCEPKDTLQIYLPTLHLRDWIDFAPSLHALVVVVVPIDCT